MTTPLDAQIGQMIMVGFRGPHPPDDAPVLDDLRHGRLGGVWLCDHRSPAGERHGNIASARQLAELIARLQRTSAIPLLVAMDAEGGQVRRLAPEYGFAPSPSAAELAAGEPADTEQRTRPLAATLRQLGVNVNLAPVVDLNRNPENPALGRRQRCFSPDPHAVLNHARAFIRAHHAEGVACVIKHFPGHGSAAGDTHVGLVDVSRTWSVDELLPYLGLIREGRADGVLTSHVVLDRFDGEFPASLSRAVTTGLLREQLGFAGVVFTDDLGMGAVRDNYTFEAAIELAVAAGADIILHANTELFDPDIGRRIFDAILRLVDRGRISPERINASHHRINHLKQRLAAPR